MPGIEIGSDSLVAAGAIVTKPVEPYAVVAGNPGKVISDVRKRLLANWHTRGETILSAQCLGRNLISSRGLLLWI